MNQIATTNVRSMTGQGHAQDQSELGAVAVEVRTVNNRGFKCVLRLSDSLGAYENRIEATARSLIRRGSVYLNVSWQQPMGDVLPKVDQDVLQAYAKQLTETQEKIDGNTTIDLATLLSLPGVIISNREKSRDDEELITFVNSVVTSAIKNLNKMRITEGSNMAESLQADCHEIRGRVDTIATLAPRAVDAYRKRLEGKIKRAVAEHELEVDAIDLLREVQIFADRSDISEEVTRLGSHLDIFLSVICSNGNDDGQPDAAGRKLDFIIQEMFRETNTIGSKASDAEISANVVEIKCAIERMRELVQNLE